MLWVLLGMLMLLTVCLFVPLSVELIVERNDVWCVVARPRWGVFRYGTSSRARPAIQGNSAGARSPAPNSPQRRSGAHARRGSWRKVQSALRARDFLPSLRRVLGRLFRSLRPSESAVAVTFGTGDPMETGQIFGALAPLLVVLDRAGVREVNLQPDFLHSRFEFHARTVVRVVPAMLVAVVVAYLFTPPPWRAIRNYVRG